MIQGRSHQIWGDQVGSASARTLYPGGWGLGGILPQKILKFRGYEIAPETIFGQYDASRRPDDRVSHECHSAQCVVLRWCRFPIQSTYRPKATPFAGEDCEINRSLVRTTSCWKTRGTILSHCAQSSRKFQPGNYVLRGRPPSNGANWQRQAN